MQLYIFFSANYFPHKNYTVRNEHITIPAHTHIAIVSLINRHKTSNILPGGKIKNLCQPESFQWSRRHPWMSLPFVLAKTQNSKREAIQKKKKNVLSSIFVPNTCNSIIKTSELSNFLPSVCNDAIIFRIGENLLNAPETPLGKR